MRAMCCVSVRSARRNLRRAGTLKNRSRTSIVVPTGCAAGSGALTSPLSASIAYACAAPALREVSCMRDTDAMLGSASPRKPSVPTRSRSSMRGDLAGRVARERQQQLVALDAAAVVAHAAQAHAALFDLDFDAARAGIDAVLDQLLEHGRRALDHLARGDLMDELFGQDADRHRRGAEAKPRDRIADATGSSGYCPVPEVPRLAVGFALATTVGIARLRAQLGDQRARRRVGVEVAAHALEDRFREALLMASAAAAALPPSDWR